MRVLDLGIVADRFCATSRTYLTYLRAAGFIPRLVLLTDFTGPRGDHRRWQRLLGRTGGSFIKQRFRLADRTFDPTFRHLCEAMQAAVAQPIDYFSPFDWSIHAEAVRPFVAEDYDDPDLHRRLQQENMPAWLYTNGGRVPGQLLDRPGFRMIHIHPGVVPHVRGSDGLFWSLLVRGRPGMSCFYMNAGIDTGSIIKTMEFDPPVIPEIRPLLEAKQDIVYAALLYAYDPHLRARLFTEVVRAAGGSGLATLPSTPQDPASGRNFYWMHPRLQRRVLLKIAGEAP
jgi:hypothetical protein